MSTGLVGAVTGLIDIDVFMSTGPLVAVLLVVLLLVREVTILLYGRRTLTAAMAVIIAPLLVVFSIQVGIVLIGH